jgi:hypothetical protein
MKSKHTTIAALMLSALVATPGMANYFHNPVLNIYSNVGTSGNPTTRDIRENHMPQVSHATTHTSDVAKADPKEDLAGTSVSFEAVEQEYSRTDATPSLRLKPH